MQHLWSSQCVRRRSDISRTQSFADEARERREAERANRLANRKRVRPWYYKIIRKLAVELNETENIKMLCEKYKLNTWYLKQAFAVAGFKISTQRGQYTRVQVTERKTENERLMEVGLGPHARRNGGINYAGVTDQ